MCGSSPLQTCSSKISGVTERFFFHLGVAIGRRPWVPILLAFIIVGGCAGGFYFFEEETSPENLWVPDNSQAIDDKKWVDERFPGSLRFSNYIAVSDNVLTPEFLKSVLELDKKVKAIEEEAGSYSWYSLCARLGANCWSEGILELWNFNEAVINGLTEEQIINDVNNIRFSPVFGTPFEIGKVLGGIQRNSSGHIVSAAATLATYALQGNSTSAEDETEDKPLWDWEADFLKLVEKKQEGINTLYYYSFRSNTDEGGGAILDDLNLLSAGYIMVLIFITVVMGRFNMIQHKIWVSLCGILCIGASIMFSYGLCSYIGIFYGPLHNVLPFLILGIGVDDMFIVVQALETLGDEHRNDPIHIKMGHVLKRAGVSITVTSLTDVAAFAIGASTILPALRSFCIYCAVSIIGIYVLQTTVFVAIVSLDHRRFLDWRDACCCCYKHSDDYQPNKCSQTSIIQWIFDKVFIPFLEPVPVKIVLLLVTAGLLAFNLYGVVHLEQDFDPNWFLPSDSYAADYIEASERYFPGDGVQINLYLGNIDYHSSLQTLERLHTDVDDNRYVNNGSFNSWFYSYTGWLKTNTNGSITSVLNSDKFPSTEANFYSTLNTFLLGEGRRYYSDIVFKDNKIWASRARLQHTKLENAKEEIDAMDSLRSVTTGTGFPQSECFPYGYFYLQWEGNRVIQEELYRNLGLAFLCVVVVTLLLIAHVWTSLLVCSCIIMVVCNIGGLIYWWDLTIDTVTSIQMILAIGLAVDYSAHIGHNFMTQAGTKQGRVNKTMSDMGPPVFYGGFSTLLAFILLAGSTSYVFQTFFKVFLGVSLYGLFHGLVYLPIMLSLVGPEPYLWVTKSPKNATLTPQLNDNPHKSNGMPPAFYNNQRTSPYPGLTPISATPMTTTPRSMTPMSITPLSVTPNPGTPVPERAALGEVQGHPQGQEQLRSHEPGTAVVQVNHLPMENPGPLPTHQDQPSAQWSATAHGGEPVIRSDFDATHAAMQLRDLPSLPRTQPPANSQRQPPTHSSRPDTRLLRNSPRPERSQSPIGTQAVPVDIQLEQPGNTYATHIPVAQNKGKSKTHLGLPKKEKKKNRQPLKKTKNPQTNKTVVVHHFPHTAGPVHPAHQRPTAREVLLQGPVVGAGRGQVTAAQPRGIRPMTVPQPQPLAQHRQLVQPHPVPQPQPRQIARPQPVPQVLAPHPQALVAPPPAMVYPVPMQYPQQMGYSSPPPYGVPVQPIPMQGQPFMVGYSNPGFLPDGQIQNPHFGHNQIQYRSPWH